MTNGHKTPECKAENAHLHCKSEMMHLPEYVRPSVCQSTYSPLNNYYQFEKFMCVSIWKTYISPGDARYACYWYPIYSFALS